jgi:hypothetical protein
MTVDRGRLVALYILLAATAAACADTTGDESGIFDDGADAGDGSSARDGGSAHRNDSGSSSTSDSGQGTGAFDSGTTPPGTPGGGSDSGGAPPGAGFEAGAPIGFDAGAPIGFDASFPGFDGGGFGGGDAAGGCDPNDPKYATEATQAFGEAGASAVCPCSASSQCCFQGVICVAK